MGEEATNDAKSSHEANVPQLGRALIRALVVLIDLDNLAWGSTARGDRPKFANIAVVLAKLQQLGIEYIGIAGPGLRWKIDDKTSLEKLFVEGGGKALQAPAGTVADNFILELAAQLRGEGKDVRILTNDTFRDHPAGKEFPAIRFLATADSRVFTQPSLESLAKNEATVPTGGGEGPAGGPSAPSDNGSGPTEGAAGGQQEVESSLLESVARLLVRAKPLQSLLQAGVNLATVATGLNALYGGDFRKAFGYRRARDLADALSSMGLVTVWLKNGTMYLTPTAKMEPILVRAATPTEGTP